MKSDTPGLIEPGLLYTVAEARSRLGLGEWAWRKMRRSGLPIVRQGNRAYVFADDIISHLRSTRAQEGRLA